MCRYLSNLRTYMYIYIQLVVSTQLKNIRQIGFIFPNFRVNI